MSPTEAAAGAATALRSASTPIASTLCRRYVCETDAELHDGLLWFREPIGDCPYSARAHCYGGVRLLIRGWAGRRIVVDQTITRCFRASLEPRRNCRRQ